MNKTEKLLNRLDKYRRMVRYEYSGLEKLSRLQILNDYYATKVETPNVEKLSFNTVIECAEELKKGFSLPLKVRGVFLTEGRPAKKYYTADELKLSTLNPINAKFPLMLDHRDREAGKVIGAVDRISYDEKLSGLRWWGHINDETFARNVLDGVIKEVSVTVYSVSEYHEQLGLVGLDLVFKELSLVMEGAEPNNYIEVDE